MEKTGHISSVEKARMRTRYNKLKKAGLCPSCGKNSPISGRLICDYCANKKRLWHEKNRKRSRENARQYTQKLWDRVLEVYGKECACCGEDKREFLTIDHIYGGGRKHRAKFHCQTNLLRWLLKKFRKSIRILCMNCDLSYGLYKYCPHQQEI